MEFPPSINRLIKAQNKGFKTVLFGNNDIQPTFVTIDQLDFISKKKKLINWTFQLINTIATKFTIKSVGPGKQHQFAYGAIEINNEQLSLEFKYISLQ